MERLDVDVAAPETDAPLTIPVFVLPVFDRLFARLELAVALDKFAVAIGTLSPNNSALRTVENVRFASSSLLISISLSAFLVFLKSGSISSLVKLKAACRSTPVLLGIYRSLKIVLLFLLRGGDDCIAPISFNLGGFRFLVDRDGDLGVSNRTKGLRIALSLEGLLESLLSMFLVRCSTLD